MTVRPFIRAPQFSATYEVSDGRVAAHASDGSTQTFAFQNGTLTGPNAVAFTRVSSNPSGKPPETVVGTWTMSSPQSLPTYMTLRSDGQVILEVSPPGGATKLAGDSVTLNSKTFTVRLTDGELTLTSGETTRHFVRRPWGCFGGSFDEKAVECR